MIQFDLRVFFNQLGGEKTTNKRSFLSDKKPIKNQPFM